MDHHEYIPPPNPPNTRSSRSQLLATSRVFFVVFSSTSSTSAKYSPRYSLPIISSNMPSRRGSRRGRSLAPSSRGGTPAGIRRHTRSRQPPRRYGQPPESEPHEPSSGDTHVSESEENDAELSAYGNSPQNNIHLNSPINVNRSSESELSTTLQPPSEPESSLPATNLGNDPISLDDMRELLRSHEEELVDRVVSRLHNQNPRLIPAISQRQQPAPDTHFDRITDLENQLAQLRAERELMRPPRRVPSDLASM